MEDAENTLQPSKKRVAGRQLTRDDPGLNDEEEGSEQETGTFKRASEEVLATRRIVKVRRHQTPSSPSSNPFASIRLVPPTDSNAIPPSVSEGEKPVSEDAEPRKDENNESERGKDDTTEKPEQVDESAVELAAEKDKNASVDEVTEKDKNASVDEVTEKPEPTDHEVTENEAKGNKEDESSVDENLQKSTEPSSVSLFQQLSSTQNAFTGLIGTGFSSSTFSFGTIPKSDQPSFSFGLSSNVNPPQIIDKSEGSKIPPMQEVSVETGEENEKAVFSADSVMYEFLEGGWKERGKGEVKVNVPTSGTGKARLVMRTRGNFRLILNASLFSDMKLANMEKKGITFACVNAVDEGKGDLSTFALKFRDASLVEEFRAVVTEHKGKPAASDTGSAGALRTPENSPKASDE